MDQFNMKQFEERFGNLALDCSEAADEYKWAVQQATRLERDRNPDPEKLAFWRSERKTAERKWRKLRKELASMKVIMRSVRHAAREGKVAIG